MPHYLIKFKDWEPTLVYEAPVDEKTKELRKAFDVDEKTGYPRHYEWRRMAKLGNSYRPEDLFETLSGYNKESGYTTKMVLGASSIILAVVFQGIARLALNRPFWSRPQYPIAGAIASYFALDWMHEKTLERAARKNAIYLDYVKKHPDRFEATYRPKLREVLYTQIAHRT